MALILSIETATPVCSVGLSSDGETLALKESDQPNIHASSVAVFIEQLLAEGGYSAGQLDGVAVSKGPGSYTGLRIGVSSAKGICFAQDIPLIGINTLQVLALEAEETLSTAKPDAGYFLIPMIDARRMEVYSAVFDEGLSQVRETRAEIIQATSYEDYLGKKRIIFFGNGASKCRDLIEQQDKAVFLPDVRPSSKSLGRLAFKKFRAGDFEDTAYFEPFYLKDFIAGAPKVKGLNN